MRIKTTTTKIYQFNELSENAKQNALNSLRDINVDDFFWYEYTVEFWQEKLAHIGFENAEIQFRGFCSQGDGASFTANIDIEKILECLMFCENWESARQYQYLMKWIEHGFLDIDFVVYDMNSCYCHENAKSIELNNYCFNIYNGERGIATWLDETLYTVRDIIEDLRLELCRKIYQDLETDYEYQTSDQAIIDTIEANEYEFTENGGIY